MAKTVNLDAMITREDFAAEDLCMTSKYSNSCKY